MVGYEEILEARGRLSSFLRPSPLIRSDDLSDRFGSEIHLKLESLQITGSFKVRGALNRLSLLSDQDRASGIVAASAGNHAQGVAWAARRLGIRATIFMPRFASISKLLATRAYGARVIKAGETYDEASSLAEDWKTRHGGALIPAFDDPFVIAGQGTIGLEILEEIPKVDSVVVPVGGGGLISGVALALKALRPDVEIIGVQASQEPAVARSLESGHPVAVAPGPTLADGIAVAKPGEITFSIIRRFVDRVITVEERWIEEAIITFLERQHLVVEGAGAAPLAALLSGTLNARGDRVVLLTSGGNLDIQLMDRIIQRGALAMGRRMRLRVLIPDRPGALQMTTGVIAEHGANILQVYHERLAPEHPVYVSKVEFDLELEGKEQKAEIIRALGDSGIRVLP